MVAELPSHVLSDSPKLEQLTIQFNVFVKNIF